MNELTTAINPSQIAILTQSTPPEVIKTRKGRGGKMLSYVPHSYVTKTLNEAFRWQWSFLITSKQLFPPDAPSQVIVGGRLIVHTSNGDIIKEQFGGSDIKINKQGNIIDIADDFKAAASDCLKKCASLLGIALDLYGDSPIQSTQGDLCQLSKAQFFSRATQKFGRTVEEIADLLKAHGFTNGYDPANAPKMWAVLEQSI